MSRHQKESRRFLKISMDLIAIVGQATGFFIWPMVEAQKGNGSNWIITIPLSIFLVSAGWWENYVDRRSPLAPIKQLGKVKDRGFNRAYQECDAFQLLLFKYLRIQISF